MRTKLQIRVPLDGVLEDDEVVDTQLGENAHCEVQRYVTIEQALQYAAEGVLTLKDGEYRLDGQRVLRQCATGQVHVELKQEWV